MPRNLNLPSNSSVPILVGDLIPVNASDTDQAKEDVCHIPPANATIVPRVFKGQEDEDIEEFLRYFEIICKANGWSSSEYKLAKLPGFLDGLARKIYMSSYPKEGPKTWEELIETLRSALGSQMPELKQFSSMNNRMMRPGESIASYYFEKLKLINDYKNNMDESEKMFHIKRGLSASLLEKILPYQLKSLDQLYKKLQLYSEGMMIANSRSDYNASLDEALILSAGPSNGRNSEAKEVTRTHDGRVFRPYSTYNTDYKPRMTQSQSTSKLKNFENRSCYACGRQGHLARECRNPRLPSYRQGQGQVRFQDSKNGERRASNEPPDTRYSGWANRSYQRK
ncbi:hypothetical protein HDE_12834 [Halotydeus destructor]|nr:hypothetical protein HDE_12834 [Halotydeus destructor]